jgi:hypothetical protein
MSSYVLAQSAQGVSAPYQVMLKSNFWAGNGGIGLIVNFTGTTNPATGAASGAAASATATVQISSDPLALTAPNSAKWIAHPVLTGITTDMASAQQFACVAIRLVLTAYASGTVALQICNVNSI